MAIEISNLTELVAINDDPSADYILVNDIDGGGQTIEPLCPIVSSALEGFQGTLDGQGFSIKNLNIETSSSPLASISALFFLLMAGEVRNLVLDNVHTGPSSGHTGTAASIISGPIDTSLGSVVLENIRITNSSATTSDSREPACGITHSISASTAPIIIRNCGIENSDLFSSYRTNGFTDSIQVLGSGTILIEDCYTAATPDPSLGLSSKSGFARLIITAGTVSNCFYDSTIFGAFMPGSGVTAATTTQMQTIQTFLDKGWDIAPVSTWSGETWAIEEGNYPILGFEVGEVPEGVEVDVNVSDTTTQSLSPTIESEMPLVLVVVEVEFSETSSVSYVPEVEAVLTANVFVEHVQTTSQSYTPAIEAVPTANVAVDLSTSKTLSYSPEIEAILTANVHVETSRSTSVSYPSQVHTTPVAKVEVGIVDTTSVSHSPQVHASPVANIRVPLLGTQSENYSVSIRSGVVLPIPETVTESVSFDPKVHAITYTTVNVPVSNTYTVGYPLDILTYVPINVPFSDTVSESWNVDIRTGSVNHIDFSESQSESFVPRLVQGASVYIDAGVTNTYSLNPFIATETHVNVETGQTLSFGYSPLVSSGVSIPVMGVDTISYNEVPFIVAGYKPFVGYTETMVETVYKSNSTVHEVYVGSSQVETVYKTEATAKKLYDINNQIIP